jgi:hypothetical protein
MRCRLALSLVTAFALQGTPGRASLDQARDGPLTLELRVFNGAEEVTAHTRLTVHRAGERGDPLLHTTSADGRAQVQVPAGLYDVQAVHEREGRVVNIKWANRLVVMAYPDERGHHLEVVNFKSGFGALQVRTLDQAQAGVLPDVALYEAGKRKKPVAAAVRGASYVLFVVPAGTYDLQANAAGRTSWHNGLEVPLDRTRFWILP